MLKQTNQLNEIQLQDLEHLEKLCKKIDGSVPNLYPHLLTQPRTLPTIQLNYEQEQLTGFLNAYFFYQDAVEIALLIHPDARRQGLAKQLIRNILPLIQEHDYPKLIFSSPAHLNNHWLVALGFTYQHSEYSMERHDLNPVLSCKKQLVFRPATPEDIPQLCLLDEVCFHKTNDELMPRFQHILNDRNYQVLLAFDQDQFVGKAHLRWQKHGATLSDIAIMPQRQGHGLGTSLITHCINYALSEGKPHLSLDVETHNKTALNLYTRLGFLTHNACDYWVLQTNQLHKLIGNT